MANRMDGLLADLAFSRDVLSEALRAADVSSSVETPTEAPPQRTSRRPAEATRPPLRLLSLGGFDVTRGDESIPYAAFGRGPARELLAAALDLYRGPLFPEWPYADWSRTLREECEQAHVAVRAALADTLLQVGRPQEAIPHFETLLAADPEHEGWHRGVMRGHFAAGERALALRQFHTCRSVLRQSQGIEPSPETDSLYLELLKRV